MTEAKHRPRTGWFSGAVIAVLGTVNLWKVPALQDAIAVDLTLLSSILAVLVTVVALFARRLTVAKSWAPLFIGFGLFVPALLTTSFRTTYSVTKSESLFTLCLLAVFAPMVTLGRQAPRVWFLRSLGLLSVALSAWLLVAGNQAASAGREQLDGANPIGLGRVSAIGVVIFAICALRMDGAKRATTAVLLVLCGVAAVSTGSRGPVGAAVAAVALVSLLKTGERKPVRTFLSLSLVGIGAWQAVTFFAPTSSLERLTQATGGASDDARINLAKESVQIAWNHWGGVGWGDLGDYLSLDAISTVQGDVQYPHNMILEVLAEGGVLALIGLAVLLAISWKRLRKNSADLGGQITLGLWLLALGSAMTSSDIVGNRFVWVMIGVGLALPSITKSASFADDERPLRLAAPST